LYSCICVGVARVLTYKDARNVQREVCFLEVLSGGSGPPLAVVCVVLGDALHFSFVTAFFISEFLIVCLVAGHVAASGLKTKRITDF